MKNRVAELRQALGLTQGELALASRLTRPLVSAVETGRHVPSVKAALALAKVLGAPVEEVFGDRPLDEEQVPALGTVPEGPVPIVAARVGDRLSYHPLPDHGAGGPSWGRADGSYAAGRVELFAEADPTGFAVAGCEPALGLAASLLPAVGPHRLVAIAASSADAVEALNAGRIHAAVVHGRPGHLRRTGRSARRFLLAGWQVGLASRTGLASALEQLAHGRLSAARREPGAESQKALERALEPYGGAGRLAGPPARGHLDAARQVAHGLADVGVTIEAAALAYGLVFAPLEVHRVELRIAEEWQDHPGARSLLELFFSENFRRRLQALGGYDLSAAGPVA
jgi:molybdate-binding protein/transcriptional regulator with XRE-family HTH domain